MSDSDGENTEGLVGCGEELQSFCQVPTRAWRAKLDRTPVHIQIAGLSQLDTTTDAGDGDLGQIHSYMSYAAYQHAARFETDLTSTYLEPPSSSSP